ncbi:MAG: glycosyltransferase family 2 protein [Anaerolineales bacterium]|nr:glycosyltransferase family 2 protein [Anaerolineales bacterium]
MRVGQNPIKSVESIAPPAPVTVVVISYIPFLSGYYTHSLELLRLCLGSIHANTEGSYDLMVFDNGSCAEVREYLLAEQTAGRIQYLTLSERNLGKPAAWNICFAAAPGEFIAYADADVYFYKGWLPSSLDALRTLPQAGMVTAMPMLTPQKYYTATVKWAKAQRGAKLETGALFSWDDFWKHARSLGNSEEHGRAFFKDNKAVRLSYKKRQYWVGAAHFQFMARKRILQQVLPIPAEKPMGRVRLLDEAINTLGYLRLSTAEWHVQHMGNQLPAAGDLLDGSLDTPATAHRANVASVWAWPPLRKLLQWLNGWTFDRIHRTQK